MDYFMYNSGFVKGFTIQLDALQMVRGRFGRGERRFFHPDGI